jgi:hypothetical protein
MNMKKKGINAILAALILLALVMTGCPGPNTPGPGPGPGPDESETGTFMSSLQLGALDTDGTNKGTPAMPSPANRADDPEDISTLCVVNLSESQKTNAIITINFGDDNPSATAKYLKVSSGGNISVDDFDDTTGTATPYDKTTADNNKLTFTDGDDFYVQITSKNGEVVSYYGFNVQIGRNAKLADVTFKIDVVGKVPFSVDRLGSPQPDIATINALPATSEDLGKMQFPYKQPADGFVVNAKAEDEDATVSLSLDGSDWTSLTNNSKKIFAEGNSLYVRVVSGTTVVANQVTQYYKIMIILKRVVVIPYGTPATVTSTTTAANTWAKMKTDVANEELEWLYINRANTTEGSGWTEMDPKDRSHGRAKLMWDEDGIWVYAQVWEKTVSPTAGTHTESSVELFVNENDSAPPSSNPNDWPHDWANGQTGSPAVDVTSTGQKNGGQYRLGANGERTGAPTAAVTAFDDLGQYSATKYATGQMPASYWDGTNGTIATNVTSGYVLMFHAPWRFPDLYQLADDKELTIELQINATGDEGTRVGVLNWNNENSNSYGSLLDYGEAVLSLGTNTLGPQKPVINTQPVNVAVAKDDPGPTLTVAASAIESSGTTLSYQWYSAATADGAGTAIGTDSASYTVTSTATAGRTYYYVVVTSTIGAKTNSRKSNVVSVTVYDPANPTVINVDLSKVVTGEKPSWYPSSGQGSYLPGTYTAGTGIVWEFSDTSDERGWIELPSAVIDELMSANSLKVTIAGTSLGGEDGITVVDGTNWRVFFGNAKTGSGFNATNAIGANDGTGTFASLLGEKTVTFTGNKSRDTLSYIGFLHQAASQASTVTITSIQVAIIY